MSKSIARKYMALAIATFCMITFVSTTQAAEISENSQSAKERIVLLPFQVSNNEKHLRIQMEAAIIQEVGQQYEVLSGKQVTRSLKKASRKIIHGIRNRDCDEIRCLKEVAKELQAEIFVVVHAAKTEGGYSLSIDIKNVMNNQEILGISVQCAACDQTASAETSSNTNGAPSPVSGVPAPAPTEITAPMPSHSLEAGTIFKDCAACPEMVVIPAGSFDMGSSTSVEKDEKPKHHVIIEQSFAMGKTEITRRQFAAFASATSYNAGDSCWMLDGSQWEESGGNNWQNPGFPQDDTHPVACIDWNDAQAYVNWLSQKTGQHYQLPSESQWEYACRDSVEMEYCGDSNVDNVAWYDQNSERTTHPAATKQANAFGLYDMSGNVGEWVEDSYHTSYHDGYNDMPIDGSKWAGDSTKRVLRGGSWLYSQNDERSTFRSVSSPEYKYFDTGFRVIRTIPKPARY